MSALKPVPDIYGCEPHWDGARRGLYLVQRCLTCETYLTPPVYDCHHCHSGAEHLGWAEVCGRGTVHTFNVYHRAYHPGFAMDVPYNTAIVELEEGLMVATRIVGCANDEIWVGMPVQVIFIDHDGSSDVRLPVFVPVTRPGQPPT